jgi:hypothetical protein
MPALSDGSRTRLRRALRRTLREGAVPFGETVVLQLAHPLGVAAPDDAATLERGVADRVVALLEASVADPHFAARAAVELAGDPVVLAAFFQNLDLRDRRRWPHADAVSMLVLEAMQRLSAAA